MQIDSVKAIITGGASGLGAACVRGFRAAGAAVAILDRDGERGAALAAERGLTLIKPFDDAQVMAGQGTTGLEKGKNSSLTFLLLSFLKIK